MKEKILHTLSLLENCHDCKVILASENGSRAWGYSSSDSDYDVKGVFIRNNIYDYSKLFKNRDVIEYKKDDIDICLWDISKYLTLLERGNAHTYEISYSPHQYISDIDLSAFTKTELKYNLKNVAYHYYGLAYKTFRQHTVNTGETTIKKYLYMIRPLLAVKYILEYEELPLLVLDDLYKKMPEKCLPFVIKDILWNDILKKKLNGTLKNKQKQSYPVLDTFIDNELNQIKEILAGQSVLTNTTDCMTRRNTIEQYFYDRIKHLHQYSPVRQ
jgi:predicted nucleotidyltransferase